MTNTDENESLDPLDKLVAALDWVACTKKVDISNAEDVAHIAELFNRSAQLVQRYPKEALTKKREKFAVALLDALEKTGLHDRALEIQSRLDEGMRFEACFRELLSTLPTTAPGSLPAGRHVWALIVRLAQQIEHIEIDTQRDLQKKLRDNRHIFDPASMLVEGNDGGAYRPDSVLGSLAAVTASSITMLAISNGWLDSDGRVVVPARVEPSEQEINATGITEYLGNAWSGIAYSEEQWRFFGGTVSEGETSAVDLDGSKRTLKSIIFTPNFTPFEFLDHIASERLERYILDNMADLDFRGIVDHLVPPDGQPVAAAPQQYVSKEEAFTAIGLCSLLHFNVLQDTNVYGGVRFSEWIRGYAWLQRRAKGASAKPVDEVSEIVALQELQQVGVSSEAASRFLRLITLSKGRSDLFDTPLIRTQSNTFAYHTGIARMLNMPRVILSRLASLQVAISPKGTAFEEETLKLLNGAQRNAKSFSFNRDGETYQYDAAFVWDDILFVIECKSYSLPLRKPMAIFWFEQKMADAVEQVQRLAAGAEKYPDAVREHLGVNAAWKSIVPCVMNSLPWSMGKLENGVYILDYSAVGRFFQSRTLFVKIPTRIKNTKILVRHHVKELWPDTGPTAKHFLAEMDTPWQIKSISTGFEAVPGELLLSKELAFEGAFLRRTSLDMQRFLGAVGVPDPTADLEVIKDQLAKVRKKVAETDAKGKGKGKGKGKALRKNRKRHRTKR
jgi:hypothetical protein